MSTYPKLYQNVENLKLQAPEEQFEWPIMSQGNWNPTRAPNKVRAMFNKTDRSAFDVAYHDKKISQDNGKNFRLANYRPSVVAEKDTIQKKF
ncbi:hypothetical protein CKAH01_05690 [Colletotrichum kahawae]|uniref:Uncharacterized protein n=1 Tax=Colletotrichum kahawae TaxID=34407 RepID=A0AAD9YCD2_COLKA|nr:hypothetical protein CKAH01_05690 [Colletotrichum kahawae]